QGISAPGRPGQSISARSAAPIARPISIPNAAEPGAELAPGGAAMATADMPVVVMAPLAPLPTLESPMALPKFVGTLGLAGSKAIDKGPPVTNLQQLLLALGHLVEETGIYDVKTFR